VLDIIEFDCRAMREAIEVHYEDMSTFFYGQNLELDVHLFKDGESI
jgi:predicted DNA-binding protein